jgi:8-oxo-dGTP diphosphatase
LIAVAVVEHGGQYLIGLRAGDVPLAGYWEFPGGKVQPGESPEQAAVRECAEEAGLVVSVCGQYTPVLYEYPHARLELRFFACRLAHSPQTPRAPFRWVAGSELAQYAFPPANRQLIAQLISQWASS